jgi:hypothetical protein
MKTFTRWFVINAIIFTASVGGFYQGVFQYMLEHDASYIALVCLILYVIFSFQLGRISWLIDKNPLDTESHIHRLQPAYFMSETFLLLGLLGTTGGLCFTIVKALPLAQGGDTAEFLKQLMAGTGRTLITTIFALICTILLSSQLFIVSRNLKNDESR